MRCSGRVPLLTNPDPPPTGSATGSGPRPAASSASFATRQGICGAKVLVKYRNQRSSMPRDSVALISADELKCHSRDFRGAGKSQRESTKVQRPQPAGPSAGSRLAQERLRPICSSCTGPPTLPMAMGNCSAHSELANGHDGKSDFNGHNLEVRRISSPQGNFCADRNDQSLSPITSSYMI